MFQTDCPHTGLLSPTHKSSTSQMRETADLQPVLLRHPASDDYHETYPSSSGGQGAQKLTSQGDGKASGISTHRNWLFWAVHL
jgi:hypothetical protein